MSFQIGGMLQPIPSNHSSELLIRFLSGHSTFLTKWFSTETTFDFYFDDYFDHLANQGILDNEKITYLQDLLESIYLETWACDYIHIGVIGGQTQNEEHYSGDIDILIINLNKKIRFLSKIAQKDSFSQKFKLTQEKAYTKLGFYENQSKIIDAHEQYIVDVKQIIKLILNQQRFPIKIVIPDEIPYQKYATIATEFTIEY